jgi:hypothetical protein
MVDLNKDVPCACEYLEELRAELRRLEIVPVPGATEEEHQKVVEAARKECPYQAGTLKYHTPCYQCSLGIRRPFRKECPVLGQFLRIQRLRACLNFMEKK